MKLYFLKAKQLDIIHRYGIYLSYEDAKKAYDMIPSYIKPYQIDNIDINDKFDVDDLYIVYSPTIEMHYIIYNSKESFFGSSCFKYIKSILMNFNYTLPAIEEMIDDGWMLFAPIVEADINEYPNIKNSTVAQKVKIYRGKTDNDLREYLRIFK